VTELIEAQY